MPVTPFKRSQRGMALALVLFTLAIAISLAAQLFAITRAQQQGLSAYGFAARRHLINYAHTASLRRAETRGSGRIGHGERLRRYRCLQVKAQHMELDTVHLRINAKLPKFIHTSVRIQHATLATLFVKHIGAMP